MLIIHNALAKALPKHMHPRVDTWLKTWMPDSMARVSITASAVAPAFLSAHPVLHAALAITGIVGLNSAMLARHLRGRKAWDLPHESWKTAVANVEKKLAPLVHMPHVHRTSVLCDLSMVLKEMEMARLAAVGRAKKAAGQPTTLVHTADWLEGYTTGTISALMLRPDILDRVHANLGFGQEAIEQWVEASYLLRIYQDIEDPLPGTRDALVQLSNANPATMAFYFVRFPHYFEVDPAHQMSSMRSQRSQGAKATEWFSRTNWPSWVASTREMHALLDPTPSESRPSGSVPPGPSPWELYLLASAKPTLQDNAGPPMDGSLFDAGESFVPQH